MKTKKPKVSGIWEILNNPENYQNENLRKKYLILNGKHEVNEAQANRKKETFVQGIYDRFGIDKDNSEQLDKLKGFIAQYQALEELGKMLFSKEFEAKAIVKDDSDLITQFKTLNAKYEYFTEGDFKGFKQIYEVFLYVAVYDLPKQGTFNLDSWQALIKKNGMQVMTALPNADKIDAKLGKAPKDVKEMSATLAQLSYARGGENPALAKLYRHYNVSEVRFNRSLDLIANGTIKLKEKDTIPAVFLDIKDVDTAAKNNYLVKLPANDPRAMILGDITKCCQSIGGHSERCVIDGITRENQAFYVLISTKRPIQSSDEIKWETFEEDGNRILGQGYVWRSIEDNLVFDSWENKGTENDDKIVRGLPKLAEKMMQSDESISRITRGQGKKLSKEEFEKATKNGFILSTLSAEDIRTLNSIKAQDPNSLLCSATALGLYKRKFARLTDLLTLAPDRIKALVSDYAINVYESGYVKFTDLKDFEADKIEALISWDAIKAYHDGYVKFADLKDFEADKIKALVSRDAIDAYKSKYVKLSDLKSFNVDKIKALTSWDAIAAYKSKYVKFSDLKSFNVDKIKALTSGAVIELCKLPEVKFEHLSKDDTEKTKITILNMIALHITRESLQISDDISEKKFKALTSRSAIAVYKSGYVKLADLKDFEVDKIEALTSWDAIDAYKSGKVTLADLKDFEVDKIEALTSYDARQAYESGKVTLADLKDFETDKIKALTSRDAIDAYKSGKVTLADLKDFEADKIEALTSYDARKAYESGKVTFADLKDFEAYMIKRIVSSEESIENFVKNKALTMLGRSHHLLLVPCQR